jgi:hypothetical protein
MLILLLLLLFIIVAYIDSYAYAPFNNQTARSFMAKKSSHCGLTCLERSYECLVREH